MKISIISFTRRGMELSKRIKKIFDKEIMVSVFDEDYHWEIALYTKFGGFVAESQPKSSAWEGCAEDEDIKADEVYKSDAKKTGTDNLEEVISDVDKEEENKSETEKLETDKSDEVKQEVDKTVEIERLNQTKLEETVFNVQESLMEWTGKQFQQKKAILFIGACGIAVRAIAPHIKDKLKDSPVIVIDEGGSFVIPILSGHYGGANELAKTIGELIDATPVITTATDVNKLFAVDVFTRKNNLGIINREGIQRVSSMILARKEVTISVAGQVKGQHVPKELTLLPYPPMERKSVSIMVSPYSRDKEYGDLLLCPKVFVIGIGCRKGKTLEEIDHLVNTQLEQLGIAREAVYALASIDRKQEEEGIIMLAKQYDIPFYTYNSETLKDIQGDFQPSSFVEEQVGVDNVCERAAMACCGDGARLRLRKTAKNGITVAIAEKVWSVSFNEE